MNFVGITGFFLCTWSLSCTRVSRPEPTIYQPS